MAISAAKSEQGDRFANLRPRDAATLVVVDRSNAETPRILMGRRAMHHRFMPGVFVFPGGRVDRADATMSAADGYAPSVMEKLLADMKGAVSERRAEALGLAAIREAYEEAGIMLGDREQAAARVPASWRAFADAGIAPRLSHLRLFGRAITPPRRPRRFDTRFFAAFSDAIAHSLPLGALPSNELEDLCWLSFAEARRAEIPGVTLRMIDHLEERLSADPDLSAAVPIPYYFMRHGKLELRHL